MSNVLINRVADSGLMTIDLETFFPAAEIASFDLKDFLFMELLLKEKDFREQLKQFDWAVYEGKIVAVNCSTDAIIPMWAYMLVASYLEPVAKAVKIGTVAEVQQEILLDNIRHIDLKEFENQRVVIKGCGDKPVGERAYFEITYLLRPIVKSIMYGEPCSTVPVFKKPVVRN